MVQVSYPGVYIVEVPSDVHTVTSVSTSIAAFFGRATRGPMNKAVRCLSRADFIRTFGEPHPFSHLAHSVRHFFANGGSDCYVVRIGRNATKAEVRLANLAGIPVFIARAKAEGDWGNTIRLEVSYNTTNPYETFALRIIREEGGVAVQEETHTNLSMNPASPRFAPTFVTQSSELIDLLLDPAINLATAASFDGYSESRRPLTGAVAAIVATLNGVIGPGGIGSFDISVNGSEWRTVDIPTVAAASVGAIATHFTTNINTPLATLSPPQGVLVTVSAVGRFLKITATSGNKSSVRVRRANTNDISAGLMLGVDQGGFEPARFSDFRPVPNGDVLYPDIAAVGGATNLNALAGLAQSVLSIVITATPPIPPIPPITVNVVTAAAGNPWSQQAASGSPVTGDSDGVREKLGIIATAINSRPELPIRAEIWGYHMALLPKSGTFNNTPNIAAGGNAFDGGFRPNTRQYTLGIAGASAFSAAGGIGTDGVAPTPLEYFGNPLTQTGFHALDPVDLFNLMVLPPDDEVTAAEHLTLWGPASVYCAQHRAFLIIDSPENWTTATARPAIAANTALLGDLNVSVKTHAAVFYPRVMFNDAGLKKKTGASGAIAGLMARIDSDRGVWKAPAGVEADIRDVLGVEVRLTDIENGVLNKKGINSLRVFPNGLVNWGARTLAGDDDFGSEWKYIPIRRLALNIEESLFRGTKWVVFEPNDEPLWANIRLNVGAYMMSLFRQRAFQGTNPSDAFYVKCDSQTTTQDDRNKGIVNIEVGFAPLKPAEFVVIKIQQIPGDL